eukprot:evm.model.scf_887.8 EVM.evm.TU.scf_887.8   scf_887:42367-42776(+)
MLNLMSVKKKQQEEKSQGIKPGLAAEIRLQKGVGQGAAFLLWELWGRWARQGMAAGLSVTPCALIADMSELNLPSNTSIVFPEGKDKIFHFEIALRPNEGYHR